MWMSEIVQPPCIIVIAALNTMRSVYSKRISIARIPSRGTLIPSSPGKAEPGKYTVLAT